MAKQGTSAQAQRLEAVEARLAVADVINTYARLIRSDQAEGVAALFTPDGTFEIRDGHPDKPDHSVRSRLEGREQIDAFMMQGKGQPHPIPLIHNLSVEVDGDSATSNCVMEGQIYGTEHRVFGEYHDTYSRVDGRWLFASRTFTMFTGAV